MAPCIEVNYADFIMGNFLDKLHACTSVVPVVCNNDSVARNDIPVAQGATGGTSTRAVLGVRMSPTVNLSTSEVSATAPVDPGTAAAVGTKIDSAIHHRAESVPFSEVQDATNVVETVVERNDPDDDRKMPARKIHSIAHDDIVNGNLIFFSIDLEHCGEKVGIVQLSVVAFTCNEGDKQVLGEFDMFVNPGVPACDWDEEQMSVHHIRPDQDRIKNAEDLFTVWQKFVEFVEGHLEGGKQGVFLAWGGKQCDCEWMFKITEEIHVGKLHMPNGLNLFMDPKNVISAYTSCALHQKNSGVIGYGLAEVFCHVTEKEELDGAHSSTVTSFCSRHRHQFGKTENKWLSCTTTWCSHQMMAQLFCVIKRKRRRE